MKLKALVIGIGLSTSIFYALPNQAAAANYEPQQKVVTLLSDHLIKQNPDAIDEPIKRVYQYRPITRIRTVLPVLATKDDLKGRTWLYVRLPGRALGQRNAAQTGWIQKANTRESSIGWRLLVKTADHKIIVYRNGKFIRSYRIIIGSSKTPTPTGRFFIEENVKMPQNTPGAPYALATSARSNVLQEFAGGPGQIAIHGTTGVGGTLGTSVSHGCIRMDNQAITWLAMRIPPGTPLVIE
jgi:lipoprotein-anchoring transpeptidase ErfK/SrfK